MKLSTVLLAVTPLFYSVALANACDDACIEMTNVYSRCALKYPESSDAYNRCTCTSSMQNNYAEYVYLSIFWRFKLTLFAQKK